MAKKPAAKTSQSVGTKRVLVANGRFNGGTHAEDGTANHVSIGAGTEITEEVQGQLGLTDINVRDAIERGEIEEQFVSEA